MKRVCEITYWTTIPSARNMVQHYRIGKLTGCRVFNVLGSASLTTESLVPPPSVSLSLYTLWLPKQRREHLAKMGRQNKLGLRFGLHDQSKVAQPNNNFYTGRPVSPVPLSPSSLHRAFLPPARCVLERWGELPQQPLH